MFTQRVLDQVSYNVGLLENKKFDSDKFVNKIEYPKCAIKLSYDAKMAIFKSNNLWLANTFPESFKFFKNWGN